MTRFLLFAAIAAGCYAQPGVIGPAVFTGTGLNDATSGGAVTGPAGNFQLTVVISATGTPDTFKWQLNAGALSAAIAITGARQTLANGVGVTFAATTGHTLADSWTITETAHSSVNANSFIAPGTGAVFRSAEDKLRDVISVRDFGAKGDGIADDTAALQRALAAVCRAPSAPRLYVPAGTYNISVPLITGCATFIEGDGPLASIIFQTAQSLKNNGVIANYSLTMQDIAVNTTPLTVDHSMIGVFRCGYSPWVNGSGCGAGTAVASAGQVFRFTRFASHGFNFGLGINGTTNQDVLASLTVEQSDLSVGTQIAGIAEPINAANITQLTVENSTLTSNGFADHGIYLIAVRGVLIRNNSLSNFEDSQIKILTQGFSGVSGGGACPVVTNDYTAWTVEGNRLDQTFVDTIPPFLARVPPATAGPRMGGIGIAMYTYCAIELPTILIADNTLTNILDDYQPDGGAIYLEADCQSVMQRVALRGNVLDNIGLGGVFLISATQIAPCADLTASGTIASFTSTGDKFINWSAAYPGTFYALAAGGPNLLRASIAQLNADGLSTGRAVTNPAAFPFQQLAVVDSLEVNTVIPSLTTPQIFLASPTSSFSLGVDQGIGYLRGTANAAWELQLDTPGTNVPIYMLKKSNGTAAVPLAVTAAELLGRIGAFPFDGTDYSTEPAHVSFAVDPHGGAISPGQIPGAIYFGTAAGLAPGDIFDWAMFNRQGRLGLNNNNPNGRLTINSVDAADPLIVLNMFAGQTQNPLEIFNSGGTSVFHVTPAGAVIAVGGMSATPTGPAGGRLAGTYPNPSLAASGVTATGYGDSTHVATFSVAADGTLTAAASVAIAPGAWTLYTPTVVGITVSTNDSAWQQFGKRTDVRIFTSGTASGANPTITLPAAPASANQMFACETVQSGVISLCTISISGSTLTVRTYNNLAFAAAAIAVLITGVYEGA